LPSNSAQSAPRPVTPAKPRAAAAKKWCVLSFKFFPNSSLF
jgi:hypothetical protein